MEKIQTEHYHILNLLNYQQTTKVPTALAREVKNTTTSARLQHKRLDVSYIRILSGVWKYHTWSHFISTKLEIYFNMSLDKSIFFYIIWFLR